MYIIVGQGLAGSLVSYSLFKRNIPFVVIDEGRDNTASMIASGVYNPLTGRRMSLTWQVDEILPLMKSTYRELESLLAIKFLHEKKILKILSNEHELDIFYKKQSEPEANVYIGNIYRGTPIEGLQEFPGSCEITGGGYIDTFIFLSAYREFLQLKGAYKQERFDYSEVGHQKDIVEYKGIDAEGIIFCEGYTGANTNPYFKSLPFKNVKGESLKIHVPGLSEEYMINKGLLLIPLGDNIYNAGATYVWDDLNENLTNEGKIEIMTKLNALLSIPYTVLSQQAGIRPASHDRRPLVGFHPQNQRLSIVNGLGTKGVILAPWLAEHFIKALIEGMPISKEVNIQRFMKG